MAIKSFITLARGQKGYETLAPGADVIKLFFFIADSEAK